MVKIEKRAMTLLEIMIVIFLIGLIGSVVGYNLKGSIDEGKAFETRQAKERLRDILLLELSKDNDSSMEKAVENPEFYVIRSSLVKNPRDILRDGWGEPFTIKLSRDKQDFVITSNNLERHIKKVDKEAKKEGGSGFEDEGR